MLEAARLDPKQEIGYVTHRAVSITAEKVAINAVMAGCKPEYLPVVVAAVEGIADPAWSYHGPGTSTGRGRGAHDRQRARRPGARHQRRRQSLRSGLAREPHHRARGAAGHAQRVRIAARPARPRHPRPSRQALLRDRRERGGEPVDAAARGARISPGAEHGDGGGRRGAASVLQPALQHRRGRADDVGGRHARLRQRHGAVRTTAWCWPASTCAPSPATGGRKREIRAFPPRAHPELATRISSAPVAWRGRSSPATRPPCGRSSPRRSTSSWWPPADGRGRSPATFRAGAVPATHRPSPRRSSDDRAARSHHRGRRAAAWPTRPGPRRWPASASPWSRTPSSTRTSSC